MRVKTLSLIKIIKPLFQKKYVNDMLAILSLSNDVTDITCREVSLL